MTSDSLYRYGKYHGLMLIPIILIICLCVLAIVYCSYTIYSYPPVNNSPGSFVAPSVIECDSANVTQQLNVVNSTTLPKCGENGFFGNCNGSKKLPEYKPNFIDKSNPYTKRN